MTADDYVIIPLTPAIPCAVTVSDESGGQMCATKAVAIAFDRGNMNDYRIFVLSGGWIDGDAVELSNGVADRLVQRREAAVVRSYQ